MQKNLIYHHLQFQLYGRKEAILSALENNLTTNKKMRKCDLGNVDQVLLEWFKALVSPPVFFIT
jgi:hypothetical protein